MAVTIPAHEAAALGSLEDIQTYLGTATWDGEFWQSLGVDVSTTSVLTVAHLSVQDFEEALLDWRASSPADRPAAKVSTLRAFRVICRQLQSLPAEVEVPVPKPVPAQESPPGGGSLGQPGAVARLMSPQGQARLEGQGSRSDRSQ